MLKNARVLVVGGCGFIGSHLAERLCKDNRVAILDDLSSGSLKNIEHIKDKVAFVKGDIREKSLIDSFIANLDSVHLDYVFHLAANVGNVKSLENPNYDAEVNIQGTINLLEACRESNIKKFVYSSSSAIYGEPIHLPIKETHVKNPESPYAVSKYSAENYVLAYYKIYGLPTIALRYFNVYGTRQGSSQYANAIPVFFRNMKEGKVTIFGDGTQTRDFVNVEDVVDANIQAAESSVSGVFNIATGKSTSVNQLLKHIKEITSSNPQIEYQSKRKGEVLHSVADITWAKTFLNYEPKISIRQGLNEYYSNKS